MYDSFGRVQYILLPDEYFVRYLYNHGKVSRIWGNKRNARSQYAKKIHYDAYDRIDTILYGNDIRTTYTYDTDRQWLTGQKVQGDEKVLQDLHYQYDPVGNITEIEQTADKPTWFGGPYIQTHQYDAQNRLIRADMLSDDIGLYSNYSLSYSPSGMVGNKTCDDMLWDYWYGYKIGTNGSPTGHHVRSIYDLYNDNTSLIQWNADGQLQAIVRPCTGDMRHHWWNEAGQLVASIDNASCGYYGYDGNGNRAYKLTGQSAQDQYNAGEWQYHVNFNDAVLYVNPYFIVTQKGYTRHYYNGSMHIASQIGNILDLPTNIIDTSAVARERIANAQAYMASVLGATAEKIDISTGDIADIDGDELDELQWQCLDTNTITFRITLHSDTNMLFPALNRDAGSPANVLDIYYYHADHLGSASWITNKEGTPIEYIHYMPYGELWYNWQASSYNERFKFTGKERDTETGYDYFGARYYSPTLLSWLSPDPLSDKYPEISAYAYCKWNHVNRIDPNGMDDWDLDIYGYIVNHTENTSKQDNVYLGRKGKDGEYIRFASKTFDHGLINEDNSFGTDITSFHVTDENTATELFLFLATENIQVEIGLINTVDDGSYLITDHEQSSIPLTQNALKLDKQGYQVSSLMHNHPKGHGPSTKDTKAAKYFVTSQGANVEHRVYNGYTYVYDRNNLTWKQNE